MHSGIFFEIDICINIERKFGIVFPLMLIYNLSSKESACTSAR